MISYAALALFLGIVLFLLFRKQSKNITKSKDDTISFYKRRFDENLESDENSETNAFGMYQQVLFNISEATHNIGNTFFAQNSSEKISDEEYLNKIGLFFSCTRTLSKNIYKHIYTEQDYEDILHFIKNDFYNFCHYKNSDLNCDKYWSMINKQIKIEN